MNDPQLFMLLLGSMPPGRHTEQHDIFFTVASSLRETVPAIKTFWPEAGQRIHIDAWREVHVVDGFELKVLPRTAVVPAAAAAVKLFFINLGGYKPAEFDEFHYRMLIAAPDKGVAVSQAKKSAFYLHCGFAGAPSHIDDKFGVDVDDIYEIEDILPAAVKDQYSLVLTVAGTREVDVINLGYYRLDKL